MHQQPGNTHSVWPLLIFGTSLSSSTDTVRAAKNNSQWAISIYAMDCWTICSTFRVATVGLAARKSTVISTPLKWSTLAWSTGPYLLQPVLLLQSVVWPDTNALLPSPPFATGSASDCVKIISNYFVQPINAEPPMSSSSFICCCIFKLIKYFFYYLLTFDKLFLLHF